MAIIEGGTSAALQEVGIPVGVNASEKAGAVAIKPIAYGALGHYRVSVRINSTAVQVARSRIFEMRNTHATNLIIPTRLVIRALQTAAGTAQENSVDCFKCTAFTAVDTTNTLTPTVSQKRASMAAAPGAAAIRVLNPNANGMTGGTLTIDGSSFASLPFNVAAAINTTTIWGPLDCLDDVNGTHPFVFVQNEGFEIENRVLNVTSYGITWFVDFSWCETTGY